VSAVRLDHFVNPEAPSPLGTLLLTKGLVTEEQLEAALAERRATGALLGETLVKLGFVFEDELARVLAEQFGVPFVNLHTIPVDAGAARVLPRELGESLPALPVRFSPEGGLVVAVADPTDETLFPKLQSALSCPIVLAIATPSSIRHGWKSLPLR
jgi:Type II secretion system (T2SS), protein E, N-terminal domain